MKIIIALVLLFCFAYGMRIRPSEQSCARLPEKWQKACLAAIKFGKSKVAKTESDFLGAFSLGMKAFKAFKAIKAAKKQKKQKKQQQQEQPESDFLGALGFGMKAFKLLKGLKKNKKQKKQQEQPESDAEFLKKLGNWWNTKGKGLFEKGKNLFNKGKEIYAILKNKPESDAEFLKKAISWWNNKGKGMFEKGKNLFNKGKEIYAILKNRSESDAEFGKFLKKVGGFAKKGFAAYQKVKGLGFFSDAESENFFKKAMNWWNTKGKNYWQKGKEIHSILKQKKQQEQPESDAEFLKKLGNWWNTKGKGLFEKGKNLFNKGKEIYAILKNKSESDAEFGKFLKKVGGIAKKGFAAYQKVKGLGFFADEEEAKPVKKSNKLASFKKFLAQRLDKRSKLAGEEKPKRKFDIKRAIAKFQKIRAAKKQQKEQTGEQKPKRKFDIKSLIAKIQKKRGEKKQKKEKKVEEQENAQASG